MEVDGTTPDGVYVSDRVNDETLGDLDECNGTRRSPGRLTGLTHTVRTPPGGRANEHTGA